MHKNCIKYKDVYVDPSSQLYEFLSLANRANKPEVKKELLSKADTIYQDARKAFEKRERQGS